MVVKIAIIIGKVNMCENKLIIVDKQETIEFIKSVIESAYKMGCVSGNCGAKEDLKQSIDNLPLVTYRGETNGRS